MLSFGGAYSNHIYSFAAAGKMFNFKTIGIIRGEEHLPLNSTLTFAQDCGMEIHYMSRDEYRRKREESVIQKLRDKFDNFYLIPEGGTNVLAVHGTKEITDSINISYDYICVPCGTGGTAAGIISGTKNQKVLGFAVLKGADFLYEEIKRLLNSAGITRSNWDINLDYHFGGYAKYNNELLDFIKQFEQQHSILLDQVYTGKMMYGIYDLIEKNYFKRGTTIIAVHTGGLQGRLNTLPVYNSSPSINPPSSL